MISLQKRFLFVHIPKTAGNSIQSLLRDYSEDEIVTLRPHQDGVERFGLRNSNYKIKKHSNLAEYREALGEETFSKLFKFTCVRNPWDRMISYFFTPSRGVAKWDGKAFRKFVAKTPTVSHHLQLEDGEISPFTNVDLIMRFENLQADFDKVCERLKIPTRTLPVYNRSKREEYRSYYNGELELLVRERFRAEIEYFGYTF